MKIIKCCWRNQKQNTLALKALHSPPCCHLAKSCQLCGCFLNHNYATVQVLVSPIFWGAVSPQVYTGNRLEKEDAYNMESLPRYSFWLSQVSFTDESQTHSQYEWWLTFHPGHVMFHANMANLKLSINCYFRKMHSLLIVVSTAYNFTSSKIQQLVTTNKRVTTGVIPTKHNSFSRALCPTDQHFSEGGP